MVKYCPQCGVENSDIANFCIKCGKPLKEENPKNYPNNSGYKCPYCNKSIPIGINKCPYCQNTLIEEKHTAAIVIGYLFTALTLFFGIIPGIGGIIFGIYLLTRDNQEVHKHGTIMIVLSVVFVIINFIFVLALANSYYRYHYYYY